MRSWLNGIVFLLLLVPWTASAQIMPATDAPLGEKFIDLCKSSNVNAREACGGVVISLMNAHVEMSRRNPKQRVICPPRTLVSDEGRRVFMQWANATPDAVNMKFPDLVMRALRSRYQCAGLLKEPKGKSG